MLNTVAEIKAYLAEFEDDDVMVFTLIHNDDDQYLDRSIQNNQTSILAHPVIYLKAIACGNIGPRETRINTIFLKHD